MAHTFTIFDSPLKLFPSKVAFWPEKDTLFVADLHLGKSESHRKLGMYLPTGSDADDLERLQIICHELKAKKLPEYELPRKRFFRGSFEFKSHFERGQKRAPASIPHFQTILLHILVLKLGLCLSRSHPNLLEWPTV